MIKLLSITVENFRSIIKTPLVIDFANYTVLVGPNNSGKSNILRALNLFFSGIVDTESFNPNKDFPKNSTVITHGTQTKVTISFTYDPEKENKIGNVISEIEESSDQRRLDNNIVRLRLTYSKKGNESWQFIGKRGARNIKKVLTDKLVSAVRSSVKFKYLPVGRHITKLIETELTDELIQTLFGGYSGAVEYRRQINNAIENLVKSLTPKLGEGSSKITSEMNQVFSDLSSFGLNLPFNTLETLISNLKYNITDNYETDIDNKGAGIQTSSLLFVMKFIADNYPQRHNARTTYIWAIEEPESFLHPGKQREMAKVIKSFANEIQTIITTHNGHFVPRDEKSVYVIDKDEKDPFSTYIVDSDWASARNLLGITILDALRLWPINFVVEGPSDEIIFSDFLSKWYKNDNNNCIDPSMVRFHPAGSCNAACSMFEMYFQETFESDVKCCLILDGDTAGKKALRGLLERGKKESIQYKNNQDYFILGSDIELLFDEEFLKKLKQLMPGTVKLIKNVHGEIIDVKINDDKKVKVSKKITELASLDDYNNFIKIFKKTSLHN